MPLRRGRDRGGGGFQGADRAGKLKNWKSEKLTVCPLAQIARIPGLQDFRFLLASDTDEIPTTEPGRGGLIVARNVLNGKLRGCVAVPWTRKESPMQCS